MFDEATSVPLLAAILGLTSYPETSLITVNFFDFIFEEFSVAEFMHKPFCCYCVNNNNNNNVFIYRGLHIKYMQYLFNIWSS